MKSTLNSQYTFNKFIGGDNNRFAQDVSMVVAMALGERQ